MNHLLISGYQFMGEKKWNVFIGIKIVSHLPQANYQIPSVSSMVSGFGS